MIGPCDLKMLQAFFSFFCWELVNKPHWRRSMKHGLYLEENSLTVDFGRNTLARKKLRISHQQNWVNFFFPFLEHFQIKFFIFSLSLSQRHLKGKKYNEFGKQCKYNCQFLFKFKAHRLLFSDSNFNENKKINIRGKKIQRTQLIRISLLFTLSTSKTVHFYFRKLFLTKHALKRNKY